MNKKIEKEKRDDERVFIITDCCMWEKNKQAGKRSAHAIEVVDIDTGQLRFIRSGSKIRFLGGLITEEHNQEEYNRQNKK